MLTFMDYIQRAFDRESRWNRDNSYSTLNLTAQCMTSFPSSHPSAISYQTLTWNTALLDFPTPTGLRLHISSLPSPNLATSYSLNTTGLVDGALSYLYTSLPLSIPSRSTALNLNDLITGYRHLSAPLAPERIEHWEEWHKGRRVDTRDVVLYGRVFLPRNRLEGMYLRRVSPTRLLKVSAVSDKGLPNGGTILGVVQNDYGKYSTEYLYSTDSALLGLRGLYNFGTDPRAPPTASPDQEPEQAGLFSFGSELYYGALNKSFGLSTGLRFTTLPSYQGFPYTMTLTLNPLMGNLSSCYSVKASRYLAFSSRFDFNFYSYESGVMAGLELWKMTRKVDEVAWARKKLVETPGWTPQPAVSERKEPEEEVLGILKARVDQDWRVGLLWEGRWKELLFTLGANVDLKRREGIFRGVGLEVQYSS
jgi:distribution and morphology protein 10